MKNYYQFLFLVASLFCTTNLIAQSNQYLHLERPDDWVEIPNASAWIANSSEITMTGWFYTDELVYGQGMLGIRGGGTGAGEMYVIQLSDGKLECRLKTATGLHEYASPNFTIVPQVWQHIAWVYGGNSIKLYVNGVLKGSSTASGTITSMDTPYTIGRSVLSNLDFYYGGRVDEVTLWNKALSAAEIQDMMANELTGDEAGLQCYYKCNQGVPDGDNTSISKLVSEVDNANRAGILRNFALTGSTSNFGGFLDPTFQAISFPEVENKLTTAADFNLMAVSSAGLPVSYTVVSGPAAISGNTVSLTGMAGEVTIQATQDGDGTYNPAAPVDVIFQVLDPMTHVPTTDARSPLAGDVYAPSLKPIQLAAISSITYPELFSVTNVKFVIDGQEIQAKDWGNDHYTAWWTPTTYGSFDMDIVASNNYGASSTERVTFNVVSQTTDELKTAFADAWVSVSQGVVEMEAELPCFIGAFNEIEGFLNIACPTGGCDPWDRVSHIEAKGHNGEWIELIRYVTPYGVACNSLIDLTDFMSILQGKIRFRVTLGTFDNGFLYTLNLDYKAGIPDHAYSSVSEVWRNTYQFGDLADLQPVKDVQVNYSGNTVTSTLKLVSTGHGWGNTNTGNAAEFHEDTHHIWVDGAETFEQHNWEICNPNPDACSPQNGTWFHNRAGWCPGAIAPWFDFNMSSYVSQGNAKLGYVFDEDYVDLCHPNNPNCTNFTCTNCNDGFNPHLIVSAYLVSKGDAPIDGGEVVGTNEHSQGLDLAFKAYPNPTTDKVYFDFQEAGQFKVLVYNHLGQIVQTGTVQTAESISLKALPQGVYTLVLRSKDKVGMTTLVKK